MIYMYHLIYPFAFGIDASMLFFRQLVISRRQPLDIALDLQQRERGQDPSRGQLGLVDQPVDRLFAVFEQPEHSGFVRRYLRQKFLYVNISPVFLLVNGFCVSFFRRGGSGPPGP